MLNNLLKSVGRFAVFVSILPAFAVLLVGVVFLAVAVPAFFVCMLLPAGLLYAGGQLK